MFCKPAVVPQSIQHWTVSTLCTGTVGLAMEGTGTVDRLHKEGAEGGDCAVDMAEGGVPVLPLPSTDVQ